jgi:hypothetical protein
VQQTIYLNIPLVDSVTNSLYRIISRGNVLSK